MEIYYLWAVACCLMPFIGGGVWFALRDNKKPVEKSPSLVSSQPSKSSSEDYERMMIHYYSPYGDGSLLREKLENVDTLNPRKRIANAWDHWFRHHTADFCHDGECLAHINHYGHIEDSFWKNMKELGINPEQDEVFQRLLISVQYNNYCDRYFRNFSNLLFHFAQHWTLMPKIQQILDTDERFSDAKNTYEFSRHCAVK